MVQAHGAQVVFGTDEFPADVSWSALGSVSIADAAMIRKAAEVAEAMPVQHDAD